MLNYLIERFDSVGMEERKAPKVLAVHREKLALMKQPEKEPDTFIFRAFLHNIILLGLK